MYGDPEPAFQIQASAAARSTLIDLVFAVEDANTRK